MKELRIAKISLLVILLALVSFTVPPVSADIMTPTTTHVFFEKDGVPYNGTVRFTVNCYGHFDYPWIPRTTVTQEKKTAEKEIIYSYSATCPEYGCVIFESYYLNYRAIDTCDLQGTAGGIPFVVHDFTRNPRPENCTSLHQFDIGKGHDEYYRATPAFTECENASYAASDLCDTYLDPCTPGADAECGSRVVGNRYVMDSQKSRTCREEADQKRRACDAYLEKVDPSTMVMWKNNLTGQDEPAMRMCTARFTIPSGNASEQVFVPPMNVAHIRMDNVLGSFWCWILQLFGSECE